MLHHLIVFYFIFGTLTLIGGVIGYLKAKSVASVIAGTISCVLIDLASLLLLLQPQQPLFGLGLGLLVTLALLGRFLPAFLRQRKIMPAGMMSVLSLISLVLTILALLRK